MLFSDSGTFIRYWKARKQNALNCVFGEEQSFYFRCVELINAIMSSYSCRCCGDNCSWVMSSKIPRGERHLCTLPWLSFMQSNQTDAKLMSLFWKVCSCPQKRRELALNSKVKTRWLQQRMLLKSQMASWKLRIKTFQGLTVQVNDVHASRVFIHSMFTIKPLSTALILTRYWAFLFCLPEKMLLLKFPKGKLLSLQ